MVKITSYFNINLIIFIYWKDEYTTNFLDYVCIVSYLK